MGFGEQHNYIFPQHLPTNTLTIFQIVMHTNCVFEWKTIDRMVQRQPKGVPGKSSPSMQYSGDPPQLKLKGQMMLISNSKFMLFLCSPMYVFKIHWNEKSYLT